MSALATIAREIDPIPGQPGCYSVCLGGGTYQVNAETGACGCKDFFYRHSDRPGSLCRHGRALAEYLRKQRACPACDGTGRVALRCHYPGDDPTCVHCDGTGRRTPAPLLSDADLRDLFR